MKTILSLLALAGVAAAQPALAQDDRPRLVHPAEFGVVRDVEGSQLLTAMPDAKCSAKGTPIAGGPCFDKVLGPLGGHGRVLGLTHPAKTGERVHGVYGGDYLLYDVTVSAEGVTARPLPYATSDIMVPRNCYALRGQDIEYVIGANGPLVAAERQMVSCDGGPRQGNGPYLPEGDTLRSDPGGWHRTEDTLFQGDRRYLAEPGTCAAGDSIRDTWCAAPAVRYMRDNPGVKELDLVAARHAVQPGDVLDTSETDQWVMKRKGTHGNFKADSRWFDKQTLRGADGCHATGSVGWRITDDPDGHFIIEQQEATCGPPPAPVPADIYEAYGDDYFLIDCAEHHGWRDHKRDGKDGDGCFADARGYLKRTGRSSATVVVLNDRAHSGDQLYDGGYITYDVARVWLDKDGKVQSERTGEWPGGVSMSGCSVYDGAPAEGRGFLIVRSMGVNWARAYQWMSCPVY